MVTGRQLWTIDVKGDAVALLDVDRVRGTDVAAAEWRRITRTLRADRSRIDVPAVHAHPPNTHERSVAHRVLGLKLEAVVGVLERATDVKRACDEAGNFHRQRVPAILSTPPRWP